VANTKSLLQDNIRTLRALRQLTQAELAERCDLSPNYIAEIEAGRRFPSPDTIDELCDALGVRPFELFLADSDGINLGESEPTYALKERLKRRVLDAIASFE